jgi:acyl carrier protein
MNTFYKFFAEALEIDEIAVDDSKVLLEIEEWDSIAALGVIAFAEQEFGKSINGDQLESCVTVGDLKELILKNDN